MLTICLRPSEQLVRRCPWSGAAPSYLLHPVLGASRQAKSCWAALTSCSLKQTPNLASKSLALVGWDRRPACTLPTHSKPAPTADAALGPHRGSSPVHSLPPQGSLGSSAPHHPGSHRTEGFPRMHDVRS